MRAEIVTKMEVDLDALVYNYQQIKQHVGAAEVIPVLKNGAYGHGAVPLAHALQNADCSHIAVAMVDEGIHLRQAGITTEIIVLGVTLPVQFPTMVKHNLVPSLGDVEGLRAWAQVARRAGKQLPFHLAVDVGLGRLGFLPEQAMEALRSLRELPELKLRGIRSHLRHPEGGKDLNDRELARFQQFLEVFLPEYPEAIRHIAASKAVLLHPHMYLDAVRVGGILYGFDYDYYPAMLKLKPILTYTTRVGHIKTLQPGWGVGYGLNYVVQVPTRIALLPIGWSDGLCNEHIGKARMLVRGQFATVIGACTDFAMLDITRLSDVQVGDEVVIIGAQGENSQTVGEFASAGRLSSSQLLGRTSLRVARVYTKGGEVQEELSILAGHSPQK